MTATYICKLDLRYFSHHSCIHLSQPGDAVCDRCDGVREAPVWLHPGEHRLHPGQPGHPESALRGEAVCSQGGVMAYIIATR